MGDDRRHPMRRRTDGLAREEQDREFLGKRPFTDAERDAFLDQEMWRAQAVEDARRLRDERCSKVYDTALAGSVAGVAGGTVLAIVVKVSQWIWPHFASLFGTG